MLPLDPLTASTLLVLAAAEPAACPAIPQSKLNIVPSTAELKFDTDQTLAELQNYSMDTVDPYGFHGMSVTQAFMKGSIIPGYRIKIGHMYSKKYDAYCLWYEDITVNIDIDPTIVIAKELYADNCMRKAIIGHESKHVKVDRIIVNEYAKTIGQKLYDELSARGFSAGPVPAEYAEDTIKRMQRVVSQILDHEFKKMELDRMDRQRAVDSLEEYKSVDAKCPLFERQKSKIYADLEKVTGKKK